MARRRSGGAGTGETLLAGLRRQVEELKGDLRARLAPDAESSLPEDREALQAARERLRKDHEEARLRGRAAGSLQEWQETFLDQASVAWVLTCVFVRFLEDHGFVAETYLAGAASTAGGEASRLELAQERQHLYFQAHPRHTEREYLQSVFRELAALPGCDQLFGPEHNPVWLLAPSGDGARTLVRFFVAEETDRQALRRPFGPLGGDWAGGDDTRFLGDLYQDLSAEARDRYALLQTPDFVEEFLLDRTLEPALREFGLGQVHLIDPTCGSGHFLLGAFRRLFGRWTAQEPDAPPASRTQRALDGVAGVDLNPFAAAIARFRLWVEALRASGTTLLKDAPNFTVHVACGDSLLYARRHGGGTDHLLDVETDVELADWLPETAARGDFVAASRLLQKRYHAVVGNPPYIVDRDPDHNRAVRARYPRSAYRQYSLAVPFTERFFELAVPSGYVGMITANSFMKREFGKKLIQDVLPGLDLTHVLDTSGAYIPGHGTPTVILLGRGRRPSGEAVRAVMSIRGEPSTPAVPAEGQVWRSVVDLLDRPGERTEFVSVADVARATFGKHPWSLGGGGASELKEAIEAPAVRRLGEWIVSAGRGAHTGADDPYIVPREAALRNHVPAAFIRVLVEGESLRDWSLNDPSSIVFPYDDLLRVLTDDPMHPVQHYLWPWRELLWRRREPGGTHRELGFTWHQYSRFHPERFSGLGLAFAFVSTHNHFVLDRGGKVFKQSAPVVKLPPGATEDQHLEMLGLLNSSTAAFWLKQVCHNKGGSGIGRGIQSEEWENRQEVAGTALEAFPLVPASAALPLARMLDGLSRDALELVPSALAAKSVPTRAALDAAREREEALFQHRVALQEELDWLCYGLYGLLEDPPLHDLETLPSLRLGERAFEIAMSRRMAAGELESSWFARHGSTPVTEIPEHLPASYRAVVQGRLRLIEEHPFVRLLEAPEHKRRWQREPWEDQEKRALRSWLLDRLESPALWPEPELLSADQLHVRAGKDAEFRQVAALYARQEDVDLAALVRELAVSEAVPFLPRLRYKESGLRKRRQWEETWELQRREDRGERVGAIPVPPKYNSADFQRGTWWSLRGKLDVPKERFVLYPGAEREADPSPVLGWAGWDHAQQAAALAHYYQERLNDGWDAARLAPLLAGLLELRPWLFQWHDHRDPATGENVAASYAAFLDDQLRELGLTEERLREGGA